MAKRASGTITLDIPDWRRVAAAICRKEGYGPRDADDALRFLDGYLTRHVARLVLEAEAQAAASLAMGDVYGREDDPLVILLRTPDGGEGGAG